MNKPDEPIKLRMAAPEPPEQIARSIAREQINASRSREMNLEQSLAPFRVGSVRFLNAAPLVRGIEDQIVLATPSKLAEMLQRDELDAGLVSIVEVLFNDRYDVLDGIAIASFGEVKSVFVAHRKPLSQADIIYCDTASLTSVQLLRVILAERGIKAEFKPLPSVEQAHDLDFVMLIGDEGIDFLRAKHSHEITDLGAAWMEMTGLPFVYAAWALRRGVNNAELRRHLREARNFGLDTLDSIVQSRTEYDYAFRKDYLGWHIHYHLGDEEKRGLAKFIELLRKNGIGPVFEPRFVS